MQTIEQLIHFLLACRPYTECIYYKIVYANNSYMLGLEFRTLHPVCEKVNLK